MNRFSGKTYFYTIAYSHLQEGHLQQRLPAGDVHAHAEVGGVLPVRPRPPVPHVAGLAPAVHELHLRLGRGPGTAGEMESGAPGKCSSGISDAFKIILQMSPYT